MSRPKPHAIRRTLFFANVGLCALVVASSLQAFGASASTETRTLEAERSAWERGRRTGLGWRPEAPVSDGELQRSLFRFRSHNPAHWPFVGPLPPEARADTPEEPEAPRAGDLAMLGSISIVIGRDEHAVLSFRFTAPPSKTVHVAPGEFIRAKPEDPARFRFVRIERISRHVRHVHYEVVEGGAVVKQAYLVDNRAATPAPSGPFRRTKQKDAPDPEQDAASEARTPEASSAVVTLEMLQPEHVVDPAHPRRHELRADRNTIRYVKQHGLKGLLTKVKTTVAKDPDTGKPIGIRLAGFDKALPAERFDLRPGDLIVSIDGQAVHSRADLIRIAQEVREARIVEVVVDRRGVLHTFRVDPRDPHVRRAALQRARDSR